MKKETIKTASIQQSAPHLNLEASLVKLEQYCERIAAQGVDLVVFGESWLTGYPLWFDTLPNTTLWNYPPTKKVYARMFENSIAVNSPEMEKVLSIFGKYDLVACLGFNEKAYNGSLYNSFLLAEGKELKNVHRKLVPTFTERLVHKQGNADGLKAVDTRLGKIGGLICWEHWMPLSRQKLHQDGELIHIALWPTVHEMHQIASRSYAFEGRCFVLAVGQLLQVKDLPAEFELPEELKGQPEKYLMEGGSAVIAPTGFYLEQPDFSHQEIQYAQLDLRQAIEERLTLDITGHYARPDLFHFGLNSEMGQ